MSRTVVLIGAALAAAYTSPVAVPQTEDDVEREIRSLDARRLEAMTRGDVAAMDRILSNDLVYTHASGWRQTKAEFLASIRSGELKYHTFDMHSAHLRTYGGAVIVTGEASAKVNSKGHELDVSLLFLEAYAKQGGRWQLVAWQSTRPAP